MTILRSAWIQFSRSSFSTLRTSLLISALLGGLVLATFSLTSGSNKVIEEELRSDESHFSYILLNAIATGKSRSLGQEDLEEVLGLDHVERVIPWAEAALESGNELHPTGNKT